MRVTITPQAARSFDALPTLIKVRVLRIFERLRAWPDVSGAKPLRGSLAGRFRLRTGDYRVQVRVEKDQVVVERLGHRDGFYEE